MRVVYVCVVNVKVKVNVQRLFGSLSFVDHIANPCGGCVITTQIMSYHGKKVTPPKVQF